MLVDLAAGDLDGALLDGVGAALASCAGAASDPNGAIATHAAPGMCDWMSPEGERWPEYAFVVALPVFLRHYVSHQYNWNPADLSDLDRAWAWLTAGVPLRLRDPPDAPAQGFWWVAPFEALSEIVEQQVRAGHGPDAAASRVHDCLGLDWPANERMVLVRWPRNTSEPTAIATTVDAGPSHMHFVPRSGFGMHAPRSGRTLDLRTGGPGLPEVIAPCARHGAALSASPVGRVVSPTRVNAGELLKSALARTAVAPATPRPAPRS